MDYDTPEEDSSEIETLVKAVNDLVHRLSDQTDTLNKKADDLFGTLPETEPVGEGGEVRSGMIYDLRDGVRRANIAAANIENAVDRFEVL